jgi:hypothetical protein
MAGAPPGNTNATKSKPWQAAIERALNKRSLASQKDALDELAEKLLVNCDAGDMVALKELGDRLDGKAVQAVTGGGPDDNPVYIVERTIVRPSQAQDPHR